MLSFQSVRTLILDQGDPEAEDHIEFGKSQLWKVLQYWQKHNQVAWRAFPSCIGPIAYENKMLVWVVRWGNAIRDQSISPLQQLWTYYASCQWMCWHPCILKSAAVLVLVYLHG